MVQAQGPMPTPLVQLARAATLGATDVRDLACYGTVATCMRSRAGLLVCCVIVLVPPCASRHAPRPCLCCCTNNVKFSNHRVRVWAHQHVLNCQSCSACASA